MSSSTAQIGLSGLLAYLDGLPGRPPLAELSQRMKALEVDWDELQPYLRFATTGYARNLVRAGEHYHLLALCWRPGQRSPIHDHARSACAFRILRGVATETRFEMTPCGQVKAVDSREFRCGQIVASRDDDMHQISNLSADEDLITLHLYTPPLMRMQTFSIDGGRGQDIVTFAGHADGCGI